MRDRNTKSTLWIVLDSIEFWMNFDVDEHKAVARLDAEAHEECEYDAVDEFVAEAHGGENFDYSQKNRCL